MNHSNLNKQQQKKPTTGRKEQHTCQLPLLKPSNLFPENQYKA